MKSSTILVCFLVFAAASYTQANLIDDIVNEIKKKYGELKGDLADVKAEIKKEIEDLKKVAQLIKTGQGREAVKQVFRNHPEVQQKLVAICNIHIVQKLPFAPSACQFIESAGPQPTTPQPQPQPQPEPAPAPQPESRRKRSLVSDVTAALQKELADLKEIAQAIRDGKSLQYIATEILQNHPGLKQTLDQVCTIQLLHKLDFVNEACNALAQIPPAKPAQRGLHIGFNPFAPIQKELEHLKEIAEAIAAGQSPQQIVDDILQNHPEVLKGLLKVCKINALRLIGFVDEACDALESVQISTPAPTAAPTPAA